ncbi:hypothetical protein [Cellulophaga sp. Z1A5H]|uniref:hypothetical protein n=1 Tax=Cellulophaga sp. Z1A5H TaxID=2687291 RepID=UPI0013FDABBD|nr:hypothetical protein [Cellulophaga sp. Z1A5H]
MKYYHLTNSTELEDISFYPQTKLTYSTNSFDEKLSYEEKFVKHGKIEINSKSRATNLLDKPSGGKGLIIDKKLKNLLLEFSIPSHRIHTIPTTHKNIEFEYFWISFVPSTRHLDYAKSEFEIINSSKFKVLGKLELKSAEFYNRIQRALTFEENTRVSKLVFKDSFPKNDLINFQQIRPGEFISEKLKDRLIKEKITGIEITEAEIITMHNKT